METSNHHEVVTTEERRLQLEEQVNSAFNNPAIQVYNPELGNTEEQLMHARETGLRIGDLPDDSVINFGSPKSGIGEVFVADSNEYPLLYQMAIQKLINVGIIPKDRIEEALKTARDSIDHELQHAVAVKDQKGVILRYGFRFYKEPAGSGFGITPLIQMGGTITARAFKDSVASPSDLSASDRYQLGQ